MEKMMKSLRNNCKQYSKSILFGKKYQNVDKVLLPRMLSRLATISIPKLAQKPTKFY